MEKILAASMAIKEQRQILLKLSQFPDFGIDKEKQDSKIGTVGGGCYLWNEECE
jgi:hypothetical protein